MIWSLFICAWARPLPLDQAIALGRENHLQVLEASLQVEQEQSRQQLARATFDPRLSASATADVGQSKFFLAGLPASSDTEGWTLRGTASVRTALGGHLSVTTRLDRDTTTTLAALGGPAEEQTQSTWAPGFDVTLRQDLLVWLRKDPSGVDLNGRRLSVEGAAARRVWAEHLAVADVSRAWWDWWLADAYRQVATDALVERTALYEQTRSWLEVGTVAPVELDRVTADKLGAEIDAVDAEAAVNRQRRRLCTLLALPLDEAIEPTGDIDVYVVPEDLSVDRSAELAVMSVDLRLATSAAERARDQGLPALDVIGRGGVGTLENSFGDGVSELDTSGSIPYGSIGIELETGLGQRHRKAQRALADTNVQLSDLALRRRRDALEADLRAASDRSRDADRRMELARQRLDVALKTEDGERVRAEQGLGRLDELLVASQSRVRARASVEEARVQQARAHLDLALLAGTLLDGATDDR